MPADPIPAQLFIPYHFHSHHLPLLMDGIMLDHLKEVMVFPTLQKPQLDTQVLNDDSPVEDPFIPCNKLPGWKLIFMSQKHTYALAAWSEKCLPSQIQIP